MSTPPKPPRETFDLSVPELSASKLSNESSSQSNDSNISITSIENTKNIIVKPIKTPKIIFLNLNLFLNI